MYTAHITKAKLTYSAYDRAFVLEPTQEYQRIVLGTYRTNQKCLLSVSNWEEKTYIFANSFCNILPSIVRIWSAQEYKDLLNIHSPQKAPAPAKWIRQQIRLWEEVLSITVEIKIQQVVSLTCRKVDSKWFTEFPSCCNKGRMVIVILTLESALMRICCNYGRLNKIHIINLPGYAALESEVRQLPH